MTRRVLALAVLVLAALAGLAAPAHAFAGQRYWPNITARPIFQAYLPNTAAGTWGFQTTYMQQQGPLPPDTVMVVTDPDGVEHENDNSPNGGKGSLLWLSTTATSGHWIITVFAAQSDAYGLADIFYKKPGAPHWTLFFNDAPFGGTIFLIYRYLAAGKTFRFQTAQNPGGALSSMLLLYDQNWQQVGEAANNGPGNSAWLTGTIPSYGKLVMGTLYLADGGSTALIANDCLYTPDDPFDVQHAAHCWYYQNDDSDADNLSDELEAQLGTSPTSFDTDGDGLYDYYEVLGRQIPGNGIGLDENLRALGANPLRRDLFVEVDQRCDPVNGNCTVLTSGPMSEPKVQRLQDIYADVPQIPANPDGTHQIDVHVDTGGTCSDITLCGDWGGHSVVSDSNHPTDPNYVSAAWHMNYAYVSLYGFMAPVRRGLFHYGFREAGGTGQAFATPGSSFWFPGDDGPGPPSGSPHEPDSMAHELGHNLGLHHWGADTPDHCDGENYKFNYPSLMNYDFEYYSWPTGTTVLPHARFSRDTFAPLSHLDLDELSWSPGVDKSRIENVSISTQYQGLIPVWATAACPQASSCPSASNPADALDFNGDGRWTAGGVQFDYSPLNVKASGRWPVGYGAEQIAPVPEGGPGLAAVGNELYAIAVYPQLAGDGALKVMHTSADTGSWSSLTTIALERGPSHTGETAASWFPESGSYNVLIVLSDLATEQAYYIVYNTQTDTVISQGLIPGWPSGVTARQATVFGGTVVFRDNHAVNGVPTNDVWMATLSPSLTWTSPVRVTTGGTPMKSNMTPGLTTATDGDTYLVTQFQDNLRFFHRPSGTSGDFTADLALQLPYSDPDSVESGRTRLDMIFLHYLKADGNQFSDGSGYLAVFSNYKDPGGSSGDNWQRIYTGGYIGPNGDVLMTPRIHRQATVLGTLNTNSVAAVLRGDRAVVVYDSIDGSTEEGLFHVPYANGVPPVDQGFHHDNDDAAVISDNMCKAAWDFICPERCDVPFPSSCSPGTSEILCASP